MGVTDGVGGIAWSWASSSIFWIAILGTGLILLFGMLYIRKQKRLSIPVIEISNLGGGKAGIKYSKAGWFKSRSLFGLIDYAGEQQIKMKDGRTIQLGSSEDFHDINGKRGLLIQRKSDDPNILLPLNQAQCGQLDIEEGSLIKNVKLTNPNLIMSIAPADYRDTAVKLNEQAERETMSKFMQYAPIIGGFIMVLVLLIVVILVIQFAKSSMAESWKNTMEAIKLAGQNKDAIASTLAPICLPIANFGNKIWKKN